MLKPKSAVFNLSAKILRNITPLLFDHGHDGIAIVQDGRILAVNDTFRRFFPVDTKKIIGTPLEDWLPAEIIGKLSKRLAEIPAPGGPPTEDIRCPLPSSDSQSWVHLRAAAVAGMRESVQVLFAALPKDRNQPTQSSKRNGSRYRSLFALSKDAIALILKDGRIVEVNDTALKLIGYSASEQIVGRSVYDFIVGKAYRKTVIRQFSRNGYIRNMEISLSHLQGREVPCLLSVEWIDPDSGPHGLIACTVQDITSVLKAQRENKRLTQQLRQAQKMEAIGTLAGGIAHDFNNILTAVLGYADLAMDKGAEIEEVSTSLEGIMRAGQRARQLTSQILTFGRQTERKHKPVRFSRLINETTRLLSSTLPSTIEIRQRIHEEDGMVMADPSELHQILMNLGTNAFHAMRKSGGLLELSLKRQFVETPEYSPDPSLLPGPYLHLAVRDTGAGMPPEVIERIFEPYFTTKEKDEGTGLGLAVVHGIINSHQGCITAESTPGQGSTFNILLPELVSAEKNSAHHQIEIPPSGNEHVMVVDDEQDINEVVAGHLQHFGYQASVFTDATEAFKAFSKDPKDYDILITDMTMPVMTGDQLIVKIRKIEPELPVILCTGYSENMTQEKAMAMGIDRFMLKPVARNDLLTALREVIDHRGRLNS